jgi:uncharacterized protein (TIGR03435 family)
LFGERRGQKESGHSELLKYHRCLYQEMKFIVFAFVGMLCARHTGWSQPRAGRPEFEVASVRLNRDGIGGSLVRTPGGLTAANAGFDRLIEMAFQTHLFDLSAVSEPVRSGRFDIVAKAGARISGDQYWEMLRALLEDRFKLKYHRETKEAQLYALILAKKARLGPKINLSADSDCPANPSVSTFCGVSARPGLMIGQRVPMTRIARELSPFADRPVQDHTGLTGSFDFQLTWTPDQNVSSDGGAKLLNGTPLDTSGPSFFSAIHEQLGLKLESQRGQIEILVIDHAEQPSDN